MATFESGGLTLAYDDIGGPGEGRPIILVHGFTSNRKENWQRLGWYGAFERRRIRMIAMDCRGHGESAKPHDPAAYGRDAMAGDPEPLAKAFPDGRAVVIPGMDHFSIIGHALFKATVFDFLDGGL